MRWSRFGLRPSARLSGEVLSPAKTLFCGAAKTVPGHLWDALLGSRFRRLALRRLPTAVLLRGVPSAELLELRDLRPCIPDTAFVRVIVSVRERVGKVSIVGIEGSGPEHAAWRALSGLPELPAIGVNVQWQPAAEPPPPTSPPPTSDY